MASCCGHEHYGDREHWLSVDELIEVVRKVVQHELGTPDRPYSEEERARVRDHLDDEHPLT